MKHLMLDIETMGNGSYAAVTSIAAVEFDLETGKTGREFHKRISLQSSLDMGLKVTASTLLWWLDQTKEAQKELHGVDDLFDTLVEFNIWVGDKEYQVWGNGASFDCSILRDAFEICELEAPWKFFNERDVRTLSSLIPDIKKGMKFEGEPHNPIDDCKHQIKYCNEIYMQLFPFRINTLITRLNRYNENKV